MKRTTSASVVALAIFGMAGVASAGPLGLMPGFPDIKSDVAGVNIDYDGTDFKVTATGMFAVNADNSPGQEFTVAGTFELIAKIDGSGNFNPVGSTFTLGGAVLDPTPALLGSSAELLKGNLTRFGFLADAQDVFEFEFVVTGNDPLLPSFGSTGGITLTTRGVSPFDGTFGSFSANADMDVYATAVPTPSASIAGSALFGLGALSGLARRRR